MAVNRFSPGCECCDTDCERINDPASSGSISTVWNNSDGAWQAVSDGYENTSTSGTLWSNRAMNTTDKKGSIRFQFETLSVGGTLKIYFDYVDSNNHHYLTISRSADAACTYTEDALTKIYDFVIGKVDSGTASSIASRTGVRGHSPEYEFACLEWDASHVIVHTTITIRPFMLSQVGWWNCEPAGFGLTTEYTSFDGGDYGFNHTESSSSNVKINEILAVKSRDESNCPGCYLGCPCNVLPEEFDVTVTGIYNREWAWRTCTGCENLNDTYTLTLQPDNYEKFPLGADEYFERSWGFHAATRGWFSGNCVYEYTAAGHSSPPSGTCESEDVYIKKIVLWFEHGLLKIQICLQSWAKYGFKDDHVVPGSPLQILCDNGTGARFETYLETIEYGSQYYDCLVNLTDIRPGIDMMASWPTRPNDFNSGGTCGLEKIVLSIVGS